MQTTNPKASGSVSLNAQIARLIRRHYRSELKRLSLAGAMQDVREGRHFTAEICAKWKVSRATVCAMRRKIGKGSTP